MDAGLHCRLDTVNVNLERIATVLEQRIPAPQGSLERIHVHSVDMGSASKGPRTQLNIAWQMEDGSFTTSLPPEIAAGVSEILQHCLGLETR